MVKYIICVICFVFSHYFHGLAQDGFTQFRYPSGIVSSEGVLENGQPNGYWKTYYPSGILKSEGNRGNFDLDSTWNFYGDDGRINEKINYSKGKKQGWYEEYEADSLVKRCEYRLDTLSGICEWYVKESLQKEIPFVSNVENGKGYEFNKSGEITAILIYKDGFLRQREKLNRTDKLSRKQGIWKSFYENRSLKSEGTFVDDKKNGLFKTFDKNGNLLIMEMYSNGILKEGAAETTVVDIRNEYFTDGKIKVSGSYKEGKKHGIHREYNAEGSIVRSWVYQDGIEVGSGIIGRSGTYEGPWTEYYEGGNIKEEGVFKEGLKEEKWKFFSKSGKLVQKGEYRKGKPHGDWVWYYPNGEIRRKEIYRRGREDGESIEYNEEGIVVARGNFIDGIKDGKWLYDQGDYTIKGAYRGGEKNGKWYGKYDNGQTQFKGEFVSGFAKGKHRFYFADGTLMQDGKYRSGRKNGEWRKYDEDGELILRSEFESGIERRLEGIKILPVYEELGIE